jgi:hypothetical protein
MTMEFESLTLEHIGGNSEDKCSIIDEVNAKIKSLAKMVLDDRFGKSATLTIKIGITNHGHESLLIDGEVQESRPKRKRKALVAMVDMEGNIVTQRADQIPLFDNVTSIDKEAAE